MPDDNGQGEDAASFGIQALHPSDAVQRQRLPTAPSVQAFEAEELLRKGESSGVNLVFLCGIVVGWIRQGHDGWNIGERYLAIGQSEGVGEELLTIRLLLISQRMRYGRHDVSESMRSVTEEDGREGLATEVHSR